MSCITCFGLDSKLPPKSLLLPPPEEQVDITKDQFREFLFSEFNSAFEPNAQALPDDIYWDQPISKYWINTSHNTYLVGDQLQSKSSVESYTKSLNRGCKCVELDCWDGKGSDIQAVVYHGHTLTSKILFVDILHAVDAYLTANKDSLPIILSLENHCSRSYQVTMAQQMKDILGDRLYVPSLLQENPNTPLPTPNQLRGMVVIKGKRPPEPDEGAMPSCDPTTDGGAEKKEIEKKSKTVPELARLTLFHGTKFKSFDASSAMDNSHMHSIGESKFTKILNKGLASDWRKYNQYHMTRTYPAGFRVDSSNYNPTIPWAMGCQLVALNFQTPDTSLLLNDGRFRQAGGSGYVLKPDSVLGLPKPKPLSVKISILAGNCLPKPMGGKAGEVIDPYVRVELHDVADKGGKEEYVGDIWSSPTVTNNGFCPTWQQASRVFNVQHPDVAMFLFQVLDDDGMLNEAVGSCAIPMSCLRSGTRSVPLYNGHNSNSRGGAFDFATLLIRVDFTADSG